MSSETSITKIQKCLIMRNGVEIWIDQEKCDKLEQSLMQNSKGLLQVEGRLLNAVDIIGIFAPEDMKDLRHQKRGDWKCAYKHWHRKGEDCVGHR